MIYTGGGGEMGGGGVTPQFVTLVTITNNITCILVFDNYMKLENLI